LREEKSKRHRSHTLYPILKVYVDWIITNDILESLVQTDSDPTDFQHTPDRMHRSFSQFYLLTQEALLDKHPENLSLSDVISVNLILVAQLMTHISLYSSHSYDLSHLARILEEMTSHFYVYDRDLKGELHQQCQILFGQGIWQLVTTLLVPSKSQVPNEKLLSESLAIVFKMSKTWDWVTSLKCAQLINEAIEKHLTRNAKGKGYVGSEDLHKRCQEVVRLMEKPEDQPSRPSSRPNSPSRAFVPANTLHLDSENGDSDMESQASMDGFWAVFHNFKDPSNAVDEGSEVTGNLVDNMVDQFMSAVGGVPQN
ncbi:hypothetical protein K435DRAFT_889355, partial [Dendrothele bispora CBS 962.96]